MMKRQVSMVYVVLIAVAVAVTSYTTGYDRGREDMAVAQDRAKILRLAMEALKLNPDNAKWRAWREVIDKREMILDEISPLIEGWDGKDRSTMLKVIAGLEQTVAILSESEGPPGALWYRDGVLEVDKKDLQAKKLLLEALDEKDRYKANAKIRQAGTLEDEAGKLFADVTKRYEEWLTTQGLR